jgi:hypothetical protein
VTSSQAASAPPAAAERRAVVAAPSAAGSPPAQMSASAGGYSNGPAGRQLPQMFSASGFRGGRRRHEPDDRAREGRGQQRRGVASRSGQRCGCDEDAGEREHGHRAANRGRRRPSGPGGDCRKRGERRQARERGDDAAGAVGVAAALRDGGGNGREQRRPSPPGGGA